MNIVKTVYYITTIRPKVFTLRLSDRYKTVYHYSFPLINTCDKIDYREVKRR